MAKKKNKKINKDIVIIALVIIIPILLIFITNFISEFFSDRDARFYNLSISINDTSNCFKILDKILRNKCFTEKAKANLDSSICEHIQEFKSKRRDYIGLILENAITGRWRTSMTNYKGECVEEVKRMTKEKAVNELNYNICRDDEDCVYQIALILNESNRCKKFTNIERKDACYINIAKSMKDMELCKDITDPNTKGQCYYFFSTFIHEEKLCELVPDDKVPECYYHLALNKTEISYCNKTRSSHGECYFTLAKTINQLTYCFYAAELQGQCWNYFAWEQKNNEFCKLSPEADYCYFQLALKTNDSKYCVLSGPHRTLCFYQYAVNAQDPSSCQYIVTSNPGELSQLPDNGVCRLFDDRLSCCIYQASTTDASYCSMISKEQYQYKCYSQVAQFTMNLSMCNKAGDYRGNCYYEMAKKMNNESICKEAGPWKPDCDYYFNNR